MRSWPGRDGLERLLAIASTAGDAVMRHYGHCGPITEKCPSSPVTVADREAHNLILRELQAWTPDVPVVSEEGLLPSYDERRPWHRFWLVDPLDGTKEFISGNGEFTVNVALIEAGEPVLGVVAAPALDLVYFAERGRGAWKRLADGRTERIRATRPDADVTRVVESRSHPTPQLETFIATLGPVERVRLGSSLKFCWIAEGRADIYPRFGPTMEWDVAAGDCVYRNAGADGSERESPLRYNQATLSTPRFIVGEPSRCAGTPASVHVHRGARRGDSYV
jgi:3'(2'), 5'-bisphosphate nucleotidase